MEPTYRTKAIILDRQPYQENDSRVIAYSWDWGKLELTARGTTKLSSKLAGHLEPFNLVDLMVIIGRGMNYAGAVDNLSAAVDLKNDWDKLSAGTYVLSLYKKLIKPGVTDRKSFLLLAQFIYWLNAIEASPLYYKVISRLAIWKFLNLLGLASVTEINHRCAKEVKIELVRFSQEDFAENLKIWRPTASLAKGLLVCLDEWIPNIIAD